MFYTIFFHLLLPLVDRCLLNTSNQHVDVCRYSFGSGSTNLSAFSDVYAQTTTAITTQPSPPFVNNGHIYTLLVLPCMAHIMAIYCKINRC
jgi:hypothetical protein